MLENMLKWMTDSETNLTIVCRHRWSRKMTMKVDKYLKLPAMSTDNSQIGVAICHPF
jgi:hypothetical protein